MDNSFNKCRLRLVLLLSYGMMIVINACMRFKVSKWFYYFKNFRIYWQRKEITNELILTTTSCLKNSSLALKNFEVPILNLHIFQVM